MKVNHLILRVILFLCCSVSLHAEQLPQFDSKKYSQQVFWLIIIFSLLYTFIKYFVIPSIVKLKDKRKNRILDTLEKTSKINKEIMKIEKEINETQLDILQTEIAINDDINKKVAKLTRQKNEAFEEYKAEQNNISQAKIVSTQQIYHKTFHADVNKLTKIILQKINLQQYENKVK